MNTLPDCTTRKKLLSVLQTFTDPLFFVCNDPLWAIGLETELPNYHIVCIDDRDILDMVEKKGVAVFCLERALGEKNAVFRSTTKLVHHPLVHTYIQQNTGTNIPHIIPFKPSASLAKFCEKEHYKLVSASWELNAFFEDKIQFSPFAKNLGLPCIPYTMTSLTTKNYDRLVSHFKTPFVVQSGHGFAGSGTFFIANQSEWDALVEQFPEKQIKVSPFIKGTPLTINACATKYGTLHSPLALQITGLPEFTTSQGGTCGTSWDVQVPTSCNEQAFAITKIMGEALYTKGFRGIFGLDFLYDAHDDHMYLIENNARMVASIPFYTDLQNKADQPPLLGYHFLELLDIPYVMNLQKVQEVLLGLRKGSQLILRNVTGDELAINTPLESGLYTQLLDKIDATYQLKDSKEGCALVFPVSQGREVNSSIEYARLRTEECFINTTTNQLLPWVMQFASHIQETMGIPN